MGGCPGMADPEGPPRRQSAKAASETMAAASRPKIPLVPVHSSSPPRVLSGRPGLGRGPRKPAASLPVGSGAGCPRTWGLRHVPASTSFPSLPPPGRSVGGPLPEGNAWQCLPPFSFSAGSLQDPCGLTEGNLEGPRLPGLLLSGRPTPPSTHRNHPTPLRRRGRPRSEREPIPSSPPQE